MTATKVNFSVNGSPVSVSGDERHLLLIDYLQEDLGLTGTKFCCGIGVCRACTVKVQRQPDAPMDVLLSCSTPLSTLDGFEIFTIENVAVDNDLHPLQEAFLTNFAFQCGYCTSGFLMAAISLWDRLVTNPIPKPALDAAIENAIGAHICRCTGYVRYHEAVKSAIINQGGLVI